MNIEILHRDEHLVAIAKPTGLLVHRSLIDRRETRFAVQLTRDAIGQRVYTVHRLDKPTSGVLVFALNPEIARALTGQFTERRVSKTYHALVRGWIDAAQTIDYPLREQLDRIADADAEPDKDAQAAITALEPLAKVELPHPVGRYPSARYSWLALRPQTGRKHQLRRHLKHIFHPIVGDTSHGDGRHNDFFRREFDSHRLLLHASTLQLQHPVSGEALQIEAPLPADMTVPLSAIGIPLQFAQSGG